MKSQATELSQKAINALESAKCIRRLALSLKNVDKQSITIDELNAMANLIIQKAKTM